MKQIANFISTFPSIFSGILPSILPRAMKNIDVFIIALTTVTIVLLAYTLQMSIDQSDFSKIVSLLLIDLIVILLLTLISIRRILAVIFRDYTNSRLRARIILMFSIVAAIPTIIISSFSVLIFTFGLQTWFDKEVSTAVNQSVRVADLYIAQNKLQLRDSANAIASDINALHFELLNNELLAKVLTAHAEMRGLTEAIIFEKSSYSVLAHTSMGFGLTLWALPKGIFDRADNGDVAEVNNEPGKIKMLVKLADFPGETYLLVGKIIDEETTSYIDQTKGAAAKYKNMLKKKKAFQVSFGFMFLLVSGVLISATIVVGAIFANRITRPIRKLVQATELVQAGDLTIQVPITPGKEDELVTLSNAFNKMIKKLDIQQKDLAIAHTAMAWSDVARRVAHEIKNPLTPITLSAERLAKKFKDQVSDPLEFQKYIAIILRHINDIEKIVTEFIDFSKMPSPKFELENIVSIIRDLVESKSIINDNIKYEFGADKDDIEFMCDKTQIHQLIINLLKNAEEALEMDSIVDKRITTSINISDEELVIMIRDNGKGFALNFLNKATDAYTSNNSKGMGLGLSIVKKIAYDHGGDVIISNAEGGGAEVKLVFNAKTIGLKVKK